jgi:hypothetical protein
MVRLSEAAASRSLERLLPAALAELRRSIDELLETFWDEAPRSRVCEQAAALAQAAKLQGLVRVFALARALASICFITREEAASIRKEVAEKLRELLGLLDDACGRSREEQTG